MVTIRKGEKIYVGEYFRDSVRDGEGILTSYPNLNLDGKFRISAYIAVVIKEGTEFGGTYRTSEFAIYTDVTSSSFEELAASLQDRVNDLFLPIEKRRYGNSDDERRTSNEIIVAVAFSDIGALTMAESVELEKGYRIDIPLQINGGYNISIASAYNPKDENGKVIEQNRRSFGDEIL